MKPPFHGTGRDREYFRHLAHRYVHEIVQHQRLLHVIRQTVYRIAQNRSVHLAKYLCARLVVRLFLGNVRTGELHLAGHAPNALCVDVHKYARHPPEEGRLLKVTVDVVDDDGERAVYKFLGIGFIGAKATCQGHKPGFVLVFQPFCAFFPVASYFIDDRWHFLWTNPPLSYTSFAAYGWIVFSSSKI